MVSLDSRVQWTYFTLNEWIDHHPDFEELLKETCCSDFRMVFQNLSQPTQHLLIETLTLLITLHADKDIILCAYLAIIQSNNQHYPEDLIPERLRQMVYQYQQLARILETVAVVSSSYKEHIRKMLLATVDDPRVVIIMLSKVLAILRHVHDYDSTYMLSLAKMTLEIFAPIAHRLGMGQIKWEMEDHAFRCLYPEQYQELKQKLSQSRQEREEYITDTIHEVQEMLNDNQIQGSVSGRSKHLYSIWKKMTKKNKNFYQIYDLNALRIIVDSDQDCYRVLGLIHTKWRYLPEEFDDYVANPKINGYQSIHTAVFGPKQRIIEVQIRTNHMHKSADFGIAAHWMYKDGSSQQQEGYHQKLETLRNLLQKTDLSGSDTFDHVKDEIFGDRTYVFTPKGAVFDLPKGATALDLAYHIHSDLGHHCCGARIQGKMIPLTEPLVTGQIVEILTNNRMQPSRDWLNPHYGYIKTSRARQKVSHWFRSLDRGRLIQEGKQYLDKQLRRLGALSSFSIDDLVHKLHYKNKDDFYHAISLGDLKITKILDLIEPIKKPIETEQILKENLQKKLTYNDVNFGISEQNIKYEYASCCHPVFPQPIVGILARGRGIVVHTKECFNLKSIPKIYERLIQAQWSKLEDEQLHQHNVILKITALNHPALMTQLTSLLLNFGVSISHLSTETDQSTQLMKIFASFSINSLSELHRLIDRIQQLNSVIDIERI